MTGDATRGAPLVVSYGAGVDSTAMLVEFVRRQIRPQYILFADTGGEKDETLAFLPVMDAYLRKVGFPGITVVRYVPQDFKHWPPYATLEENCLTNSTLPSLAFGFKSCSQKWKIAPQHTYLKHQLAIQEQWRRGRRVVKCIGFDADPADLRRRNHAGDPQDRHYEYRYPLIDWGWGREWCKEEIAKAGLPIPPKSSCFFCLSGETEVVTRDGIKPIRDLANGTHEVLVPRWTTVPSRPGQHGLSSDGMFKKVEVRSFGSQQLFKVRVSRGGQKKVVYATAEHRWLIWGKRKHHKGWHPTTVERTTCTLTGGDRLRSLKAVNPVKTVEVPFAVAQGFIYGDGSRGIGERPATLSIYNQEKDGALLPYFAKHQMASYAHKRLIYGLPRTWKSPPSLSESKSFLLSWLAGYVAADGDVSKTGHAAITSASLESVKLARDVMAICGVRYGIIRSKLRSGFGRLATPLYTISLDARDVPEWFFLIPSHASRVKVRLVRLAGITNNWLAKRESDWTVESVEATDRDEEVYCAVVPGRQAFGLADGLMTGNCPAMKPSEVRLLPAEKLRRIVIMEARAAPRLRSVQGLWRTGTKGTRGGEPHPGSMTAFIRQERLLPAEEIDALIRTVPTEIVNNQHRFHGGEAIPTWDAFLATVAGKPRAQGQHNVSVTVVRPCCGNSDTPAFDW